MILLPGSSGVEHGIEVPGVEGATPSLATILCGLDQRPIDGLITRIRGFESHTRYQLAGGRPTSAVEVSLMTPSMPVRSSMSFDKERT